MIRRKRFFAGRRGYTLIELLITITLTMLMMFAVTQLFGTVSQGVADARSTLEMTEALRGAVARLRIDLQGATAVTSAPERPDAARGYFEIIEGPVGPVTLPYAAAVNSDTGEPDTTAGDNDDRLLFTTRSRTQPFVGRLNGTAFQSDLAEIVYFVRGRTLYRRVLLVAPTAFVPGAISAAGFYANNDISVRVQNNMVIPNGLADLAQRESRFAHPTDATYTFQNSTVMIAFPCDVRRWMQLGLPTLQECAATNPPANQTWIAGGMNPPPGGNVAVPPMISPIDYWNYPHPWPLTDPESGMLLAYQNTIRGSEDVLLNNVIGFDVKVWDPGAPILSINVGGQPVLLRPGEAGYAANLGSATVVAYGAYVDLGYAPNYAPAGAPRSVFCKLNDKVLPADARPSWQLEYTYDTWSTAYAGNRGANGLDDPDPITGQPDGVVDDPGEWELPPPYAAKLRGIQIRIRVFEPSSRQVREVTVVQEFVAK